MPMYAPASMVRTRNSPGVARRSTLWRAAAAWASTVSGMLSTRPSSRRARGRCGGPKGPGIRGAPPRLRPHVTLLFSPLTLRGTTFANRAWLAPDVPVLGGGRQPERLAPGPPGFPGGRRVRAAARGGHGGGPRGADLAAGHRAVARPAHRRVAPDHRLRARARHAGRRAAGARGPQGVDVLPVRRRARLGPGGPGRLGDGRPVGHGVPRARDAPRADPRRDRRRSPRRSPRPPDGPTRPGSTSSSCTPPTATCCTSSSRRCPTSATTSTAARWRTARGCWSRRPTPSAPPGPTTSRCSSGCPRPTGSTAGSRVDEVAQVAKELGGHGVDLVDVSTGGNAPARHPRRARLPGAGRPRGARGVGAAGRGRRAAHRPGAGGGGAGRRVGGRGPAGPRGAARPVLAAARRARAGRAPSGTSRPGSRSTPGRPGPEARRRAQRVRPRAIGTPGR